MNPVSINLITDINNLKSILSKDDLYKDVLDIDSMIQLNQWMPSRDEAWYEIHHSRTLIGIFLIKLFGSNSLSFHGGLFKSYRSLDSQNILKSILNIIKTNHPYTFVTMISEHRKSAIKLVEKCDFVLAAKIKNGTKHGDLLFYTEGS